MTFKVYQAYWGKEKNPIDKLKPVILVEAEQVGNLGTHEYNFTFDDELNLINVEEIAYGDWWDWPLPVSPGSEEEALINKAREQARVWKEQHQEAKHE